MTGNKGYKRLAPDSAGPEICPVHRLVNYPKVVAELDAERIRSEAVAGTPNSRAQAQICPDTGNWHIFIPTKGRMKTLRKRARQTGRRGNT